MLGSRGLTQAQAPCGNRGRCSLTGRARGRRAPAVVCKSAGKKGLKIDPAAKQPGFKYDAANSRWVRDDRVADSSWKTFTTVQPMVGPAYTVWPVMHTTLVQKKLKSVPPKEVLKLMARGYTLVDVRTSREFERQCVEGAVSVPLYTDLKGTSAMDNVKRFVMAVGLGMRATERNVNFAEDLQRVVGRKNKVILYCDRGGSLETEVVRVTKIRTKRYNDPEKAFGLESRSLKAAYMLFEAGFKDILHMKGGLSTWRYEGLPTE